MERESCLVLPLLLPLLLLLPSGLQGLLQKDPSVRIGCGPRGAAEIREHAFFAGVDWEAMQASLASQAEEVLRALQ